MQDFKEGQASVLKSVFDNVVLSQIVGVALAGGFLAYRFFENKKLTVEDYAVAKMAYATGASVTSAAGVIVHLNMHTKHTDDGAIRAGGHVIGAVGTFALAAGVCYFPIENYVAQNIASHEPPIVYAQRALG